MSNKLPNGLRFRPVNARGDRELPILFGESFENTPDSHEALRAVARGTPGKLVISGQFANSTFHAHQVDFIPQTEEVAIDEIWCPLVAEALKAHLEYGDPNEPLFHDGKNTLTAQRVLELLLQKDDKALRFIEDIHGAALRAVRVRRRASKRGPQR